MYTSCLAINRFRGDVGHGGPRDASLLQQVGWPHTEMPSNECVGW